MKNLQEARKQTGLSQIEIAKQLEISRRSYQYYEQGKASKEKLEEIYNQILKLININENSGILPVKQIKNIVNNVTKHYPNIKTVYLFGSYARGEAKQTSDVDLLIVDNALGFKDVNYYLELKNKLHKELDLISYRQITEDPNFLREFLKDAIKIYG